MTDTLVTYTQKDKIGLISFNRPDKLNTLNREIIPSFREIIGRIRSDKELRCLIITGSGTTFCGGADLKSGFEKNHGEFLSEALMEFYRPYLEIGSIKVPVIAAINGHAIGGGFGITLLCDIRVADRKAKMGANFTRLGLHSGMAISYILPRLVGLARANELLFTGRLITGEEAAALGLVNYAVDKEAVMDKALALAKEIAQSAPAAVQMMKRSVYEGLDWNPVRAAAMEAQNQARTFEMEDAKEGISAVLEKRTPNFTGR
ncbi:MAG: enoyl-CoA hydratase/isomerase family protein [Desulfobacula sp.]|nr:enoyl-CoA hydratase/isomerase family protein [Desulfobacula sp.]